MRIIAGRARSLPLKTLEGSFTRPTSDRIKETLFNMINHHLPGACFLDLFAGSGGIGLEAVSRGAEKAVFVENSRKAATCIQENIDFTGFKEESTLLCMDVMAALKRMEGNDRFDIVFVDPPYDKLLEQEILKFLADSSLIDSDTLIIVEASLDTGFSYLKDMGYHMIKEKKYKTNVHVFIERRIDKGNSNMTQH